MKVGDIVRRKYGGWNAYKTKDWTGIVIRLFEKKNIRTHDLGHRFDWEDRELENYAEVLIQGETSDIRVCDLELALETKKE